jgi:hypothetical protein
MKISSLLKVLLLCLASLAKAHHTVVVNVYARPATSVIVAYNGGHRYVYSYALPYAVTIYPGQRYVFRIVYWGWGLRFYNFWWWGWGWYGWPWYYPYYPYYWWWWRGCFYTFPFRDRRSLLNGESEGPLTGNDIAVDSNGNWVGNEVPFTPSAPEFITHGFDFEFELPEDGPPEGVTITSIDGSVAAETITISDSHPEVVYDPHIQTWLGQWYDFQGECDLVFLRDPDFYNGLGLELQTRTTKRYDYSYIEAAAVKIGGSVLEVDSFGTYAIDGVEGALGHDQKSLPDVAGFPVYHSQPEVKKNSFDIVLTPDTNITLDVYKDFVGVKINGDTILFANTTGLLGSMDGKMLARDGYTSLTDPDAFGEEWQVRDDEPKLFRTVREPQYPAKCRFPTAADATAAKRQRRLGASKVSSEEANKACAHLEGKAKENCVFDVMAVGDLDIARGFQ